MNTIESILSQLTSNALVSDLKTVLREQDPEFPPVETAFQEATCVLASRIGREEVEKLLAAKNAGVRTVCVPKKNEKDVEEISGEIKKGLEIVYVETMEQVLRVAFCEKKE